MSPFDLARSVITTERPVAMPRKPYAVNPENPADALKQTWAALAGLSGHMVNNPPENLTFDQASIIYGRLTRALRNLQPILTAQGELPPPPQPARAARPPSISRTEGSAPNNAGPKAPAPNEAGPQASAPDDVSAAATGTAPAPNNAQFKYRQVESPEEWEARHQHLLSHRQNEAPPTT